MKSFILRTIWLAAFLIVTISSFAYDFSVDGIYYDITSEKNKTVEVTKESFNSITYSGDVIIPEEVKYEGVTYAVTGIGDAAFEDCSSLNSLVIPSSVIYIGKLSFLCCRGLTSLVIPSSVTFIADYAFLECSHLTNVVIPESVTRIGTSAFADTPFLDSLPDGDVYINDVYYKYKGVMPQGSTIRIKDGTVCVSGYAFFDCIGLTDVVIPSSVTSIDDGLFSGCSGLTSVVIPSSVTSIGDYAFRYCSSLTTIEIPSSVTSIGDYAFDDTPFLDSLPDGDVYINNVYYEYKGNMPEGTVVCIKDGTMGISGSAFSDCSGLIEVAIPETVTNIGLSAFSDCTALTSLVIPSSVTSIGNLAFYNCKSLKGIHVKIDDPLKIGFFTFGGVSLSDCTLYVPEGCKEKYEAALVWQDFNIAEENYSATEIVSADNVTITTRNGRIIMNINETIPVTIFSINGTCIFEGTNCNLPTLSKGIYLIKVAGKTKKVTML